MNFVLVIALATSLSSQSGATSIVTDFSSRDRCIEAGTALVQYAEKRGNFVLTWGCFVK